jgi:hypothetical protein
MLYTAYLGHGGIFIMEELLPNLKHDMQGFPNKEISKPAIHDKECSVRSSENTDK